MSMKIESQVHDQLRALFQKDDKLNLMCLEHSRGRTSLSPEFRLCSAHEIEPKFLKWLKHKNAQGCGIYVIANPIIPNCPLGVRERAHKHHIEYVRNIILDFDSDKGAVEPIAQLKVLGMPEPTLVVQTARNNFHVWYRLSDPVSVDEGEPIWRELALLTGADRAVSDVCHFARIAGFKNTKPGRGEFYTRIVSKGETVAFSDLKALTSLANVVEQNSTKDPEIRVVVRSTKSASEDDWRLAMELFESGANIKIVTAVLEEKRKGDMKSAGYARRTAEKAYLRFRGDSKRKRA